MKNQIIITIEGGVIQEIENIPANVEVVVRDYDIEDVDPADLDPSGQYEQAIWESEYEA